MFCLIMYRVLVVVLATLACNVNAQMLFESENTVAPDIFYTGERQFRHFEETSASNTVTGIAQGKDGVMWFANQAGITRYDGLAFNSYVNDPSDPTSIPPGYIISLLAASDGRIWIATRDKGLSVFDPVLQTATHYRHNMGDPEGLLTDSIIVIEEDTNGDIWVGTRKGLSRMSLKTQKFAHYFHDSANHNSMSSNYVRTLEFDHLNRLWVGTDAGINLWRSKRNDFVRIASNPDESGSLANQLIYALYATDDKLWIGTRESGAVWLDLDTFKLHQIEMKSDDVAMGTGSWITDITAVSDSEIWMSSFGNGIAVLDSDTGRVEELIEHDKSRPSTLKTQLIFKLFTSDSGLIWVGTWGRGLSLYLAYERAIRVLQHSLEDQSSISSNNVLSILELSNGNFAFSLFESRTIDIFDPVAGRLRNIGPEQGLALPNSIDSMLEMTDGSLMVSVIGTGLYRYWESSQRLQSIPLSNGVSSVDPEVLVKESETSVWLGTQSGLFHWQSETGELRPYTKLSGSETKYTAYIHDMEIDIEGNLWVTSSEGLHLLVKGGTELNPIKANDEQTQKLLDAGISTIEVRPNNVILVSNSDLGFFELTVKPDLSVVSRIISADGSLAFLTDEEGGMWVPGRLIEPDGRVSIYMRDYLGGTSKAWGSAFYRSSQGTLMYGSSGGVTMIRPEMFTPWTYKPRIIQRGLLVNGRRQRTLEQRPLILEADTRNFSVEFTATDYTAPHLISYEYLLEGYDSDWQEASTINPVASYTNLNPKDYVLKVRASDRQGDFSTNNEFRLKVVRLPAWHETLWFKVAVIIFFVVFIYLFFRHKLNSLQRQKLELNRLVAEKTKELETKNLQLEEFSLRDQLTQVYNRYFFDKFIQPEVKKINRKHRSLKVQEDDYIGFMILDIDFFKAVNDTHGHAAGDKVLIQLCQAIRDILRDPDWIIRWGGEEFVLVCLDTPLVELSKVVERVRRGVENTVFSIGDNKEIQCTCSIGMCVYPFANGEAELFSIQETLELADSALYMAKQNGRNAWVGLSSADGAPGTAVKELIMQSTKDAIESGFVSVTSNKPL